VAVSQCRCAMQYNRGPGGAFGKIPTDSAHSRK